MVSKTISAPATMENLEQLIDFIVKSAEELCGNKNTLDKIRLAAEEVLINIVKYAYPQDKGGIDIACVEGPGRAFVIEVTDTGIPFDPLAKSEPDVTKPMEERPIGGLGIYMVRKSMDDVRYRRENNRNVLTLVKNCK
ncbi:MAG: ATP-binding protein [Elusimicrobia bacterium]|nr:ATP-binding protein [Elusimicrobiota bacterium]